MVIYFGSGLLRGLKIPVFCFLIVKIDRIAQLTAPKRLVAAQVEPDTKSDATDFRRKWLGMLTITRAARIPF